MLPDLANAPRKARGALNQPKIVFQGAIERLFQRELEDTKKGDFGREDCCPFLTKSAMARREGERSPGNRRFWVVVMVSGRLGLRSPGLPRRNPCLGTRSAFWLWAGVGGPA